MVQVRIAPEDLVRALKRFKGLAKQDLLNSDLAPQPEFWRAHAEARRSTYIKLIELVEGSGIDEACVFAYREYQKLPLDQTSAAVTPESEGAAQAIELFFNVLGVEAEQLRGSKVNPLNFEQVLTGANFSCA